jgi:hypothetical protein
MAGVHLERTYEADAEVARIMCSSSAPKSVGGALGEH